MWFLLVRLLMVALSTGACWDLDVDSKSCEHDGSCLLQFFASASLSTNTSTTSDKRLQVLASLASGQSTAMTVFKPQQGTYDSGGLKNRNQRLWASPLAAVQVEDVSEIRIVVIWAKRNGVQLCAISGGHGYYNYGGCTDGVQIRLQAGLQSYSLDATKRIVTFGTGHTLGQLYYKLAQNDPPLLVPAGQVSGVGSAGLILGGGRGYMTSIHGLACDSLLSIKYIDAEGDEVFADDSTNPDMFWMARGGGGEFPGIVTAMTMQAYEAPDQVLVRECDVFEVIPHFDNVVKRWLARGEQLTDPTLKIFTSLTVVNDPKKFRLILACVGCNLDEETVMRQHVLEVMADAPSSCFEHRLPWIDHILEESGNSNGKVKPATVEGLLNPDNGWGGVNVGAPSSLVGSRMVYEWWDAQSSPNSSLDQVLKTTKYHAWDNVQGVWGVAFRMYFITGPKVNGIPKSSTAYGPRDAKWVLHWKFQWPADEINEYFEQKHKEVASSYDSILPCTGFYNYMEDDLSCAGGDNEKWLAAYFSDVPRMKQIKDTADPDNVFRCRTKPAPDCSENHYEDCRGTRCCKSPGFTCFEKDAQWASCLRKCTPGMVSPRDQTPWSCQPLS